MKYKPFSLRPREIEFNQRRATAFERKQQREAQALPLFADQIREQQHDWETEKERRQSRDDATLLSWRAQQTKLWRKARAMYFALPAQSRAECKRDWERVFRAAWTPTNLIYLVEKYNGIGAQREAKMAEDRRQMEARIRARLEAQPALM